MKDIDSTQNKRMKKSRAALILSIVGFVMCALAAAFIILFWNRLENAEEVRSFVSRNILVGALMLIILSAFQVIIGIIPSEAIELAAGYAFGWLLGALFVLAGIVLGSITAILLTRKFGRRLIDAFYPQEKLDALPIFANKKRRNVLTFILFAIPGTPKDLFTYIIGLTDMSIPLYLFLTTAARFPSIIISTVATDSLASENYVLAIIAFAVSVTTGIVGVFVYKRFMKKRNKQDDNE